MSTSRTKRTTPQTPATPDLVCGASDTVYRAIGLGGIVHEVKDYGGLISTTLTKCEAFFDCFSVANDFDTSLQCSDAKVTTCLMCLAALNYGEKS